MKPNIGNTDKIIRIVIGIAIAALGYYYKSLWGLLGIIPIVTALINWCPMYMPFRMSTREKKDDLES